MKKIGIITILTILVLLAVASVAICNEEKSLRGTLYRNITPNHTEKLLSTPLLPVNRTTGCPLIARSYLTKRLYLNRQ